ncbi:hypothetical protein [Mammaliicoccus sciuri]|uniref:hypothetical protein n=1 Tax=Mammaliicoccus sciuri TaxID=1296 RepID=UPI001F2C8ABA|nr:hypothetical protein [Mammaliicoccus sciuri]MCE5086344.1 replication-relaxation family protein [Mammaliicoccus sciuri]
MVLNESQLYILDCINKFGVLTTQQLIKYIDGKFSDVYIYKIITHFEELEIIKKEKLGKRKYFYLLQEGFKLSSNPMHMFRTIRLSELNHDLQVNDFLIQQSLELKNQTAIDDFQILTEREIVYEHLSKADSQSYRQFESSNKSNLVRNIKRNVPDGVISYESNGAKTTIAYELELNQKYVSRYRQKMKDYRTEFLQGRYDALVYMCNGKAIQHKIQSVLEELDININIQFVQIDEV